MNGEVFDILNYCILNEQFYIHKHKLFHDNALDLYDYLWELKYTFQIGRMTCNGTSTNGTSTDLFTMLCNIFVI